MTNPILKLAAGILLATAAIASPLAPASAITYVADLTGAAEFPPNSSTATGTAIVFVDPVLHTMRVQVSFAGLSGPNTAAHIHCCVAPDAATPTAPVATATPTFPGFPVGTSGDYDATFDLTSSATYRAGFITAHGGTPASAEADLLAGLAAGQAYLNIHTASNPGGEIRGFLVDAPEPGTIALLVGGLAALGVTRRRLVA